MNAVRKFVADALLRDWGTKTAAFLLAVILFVLTRNEVSRTFPVPLRVEPDPDRVLMTDLPDTVAVEIRGPWTRVNRMQALDLGQVTLPLRALRPGPLRIDPASVVMPAGVVLERIVYDPVDLRFEPVIERDVAVAPVLSGEPDPDHEVTRVVVEPERLRVRGGRSVVSGLLELPTEAVDVSGATDDVSAQVELMTPPPGVSLVSDRHDAGPGRVSVRVEVDSPPDSTSVKVTPTLPPELAELALEPVTVTVRGPRSALRRLQALGVQNPVVVEARVSETDAQRLALRVSLASELPESLRAELTLEPQALEAPRPSPPR